MSLPPCEPRAAYVHVPFCAHRCGYCDFTLVAGRDDLIEDYLRAMELELSRLESVPLDTLFIGGGTPTHLSPPQLARLLDLLRRSFELAPGYEFSVEANPAGLEREHVRVLADAGVNRVSLGAQSFDPAALATLERDHCGDDVRRAVERVRARIDNVSLDLIFGVPGQNLASWDDTLDQALALEPTHVSTYGLTFEKGTRFWGRRSRGELRSLSDETERAMYAHAMDRLAAAGFEQYEISNFARPGRRCRHNEVYWKGEPHYGFGPGAARYLNGRREMNHRSVTTWLKRVFAGEDPIADAEELSPEERARESIVLGLRRAEGIERNEFRVRTGFDLDELAAEPIARHCLSGLLDVDDAHVRLTREGRFLADAVIVDFL
ncbi:MAG: radical SAM family heme chaperone HemW [Planctomycetales bacterium]